MSNTFFQGGEHFASPGHGPVRDQAKRLMLSQNALLGVTKNAEIHEISKHHITLKLEILLTGKNG